jgi:hypothetical protein
VANSIVWDNVAPLATNALDTTFDHSATWPLPEGGYDLGGNLDADPQFVNSGVGNYRLAGTSPCVNAGTNLPWIVGETDLDGSARFVGVIVDMGAYEYVTVQSVAALGTPITWLDYYLLGPDWDAAELDDPDHDGFPTWKEYIALTNPTNGASFFAIRDVTHTVSQVTVSFDTALGRVYTLQHTALLAPPAWSNAAAPVAGSGERETVPASEAGPASFFRVGVALP